MTVTQLFLDFIVAQLCKRTLRVDHVEEYKVYKEENDKEKSKRPGRVNHGDEREHPKEDDGKRKRRWAPEVTFFIFFRILACIYGILIFFSFASYLRCRNLKLTFILQVVLFLYNVQIKNR